MTCILILALALAPQDAPVFKDGEAQIAKAFGDQDDWIRHDLWVETSFDSDGNGKPDRMHVSVTRQKQTKTAGLKVPVIYITSPYFCGVSSSAKRYFWDPRHELGATPPKRIHPPAIPHQTLRPSLSELFVTDWVPRGFAVVHSASPGTGLSQGCPTVGGNNESLAPKAVIDWLNGRAKGFTTPDGNKPVTAFWSTGKVGMTGTSYNGTLALAAATTGVDGLEAVIPIAPNTSYYHYYRSHGLIRHPFGYMGEDIDVLYDFINSGDPAHRPFGDRTIRDGELTRGLDRITGDYNDFWAGRDYLNDLGPTKAATLLAHGLNDWNVMPEHSVRIYTALKARGVPARIYLHQGGHGGPPPFRMMNRWFTRYLCGIDNGVEKDPRAWIVREGDPRNKPTAYADYPNPAAAAVTLHPHASGVLSLEAKAGQGMQKLIDDVSHSGTELARAKSSPHRLLYVTPPLAANLHLSGTPRFTLRLACSKPAANLSVWIVSGDRVVTRGWADPQNHTSLTESEPLVPGRFYEWTFTLQPDDQVIPSGRSLSLMIFSSDQDFTLWPEPGTVLTVDLDRTSLELPLVGGADAAARAMR